MHIPVFNSHSDRAASARSGARACGAKARGLAAAAIACAVAIAALTAPAASARQAPPSGRALGPVDLTGYWVSVISEDWQWRMITPRKGDYASVPLNPEGRRVADRWEPAQDGSCNAFGAAAIMRMPGRVHITWENDNTLKIETDAGRQTRLLRFNAAAPALGRRDLQGFSRAEWQLPPAGGRGRGTGAGGDAVNAALAAASTTEWASLKVVTTNMRAGWLRRNGVPYSENAVLTEYFNRFSDGDDQWLNVTTIVEDPAYLTMPFIVSSDFKKEPDGSKWNPTPCRA